MPDLVLKFQGVSAEQETAMKTEFGASNDIVGRYGDHMIIVGRGTEQMQYMYMGRLQSLGFTAEPMPDADLSAYSSPGKPGKGLIVKPAGP